MNIRKRIVLLMLGAKMNENHDEKGRFASGSGGGGGSVEQANRDKLNVSPIARTPIPKKDEESYQRSADKTRSAGDAAIARMRGEAGSGGGSDAQSYQDIAMKASDKAASASTHALVYDTAEGHANAIRAHVDAADAHQKARDAFRAIGDTKSASAHSRVAKYHDSHVDIHNAELKRVTGGV